MKGIIFSVEDDVDISRIINVSLSKAGYEVTSFENGKDFQEAFLQKRPDMVLLDLMLPDVQGLDILKSLRTDSQNDKIQVIIISAKRMLMDKVDGLDLGADDYIEKPFDILELISRVNAKFRRIKGGGFYACGNLSIDRDRHQVLLKGSDIQLTDSEFSLLFLLLKNQGQAVTREEIAEEVYEEKAVEESRAVDMHIAAIRRKLGDEEGKIIKTIRSIGYKIGE